MQFAGKLLKTKFSEFFSLRRFFMKKNVLKCILGIMFCSVLVFGCKEPPAPSSSDNFDPVSNNEEVKNSFDKALEGVTSTPETEEQFNEMMDDIIKEMKDAFDLMNGANARLVSPRGDAISSKEDITNKIKSIINNINTALSGVTSGTEKEIKFSFDESINIEKATVVDLLEALSGIDELKNIVGNVNLPEEEKKLINDLIKINNLYAKAKADVNVDMVKLMTGESSDESIGSANIELLASAATKDLEKLTGQTLPIKAASAVISLDANASASYKDALEIMNIAGGLAANGKTDITLSGASFGFNYEGRVTLAVCTKSGKGGKLVISPKVSIDKQFIVDYIKLLSADISSEQMSKRMAELIGDKIKISVSIGKFSKEYTYEDLLKFQN